MDKAVVFFAGHGGSDYGIHCAGLQCVAAIDNNDKDPRTGIERIPAIQTREKNLKDGAGIVASVVDWEPSKEHAAKFCFASPPCKRFSTAAETRDDNDDEQISLDEDLKNLGFASIKTAFKIPDLEFYIMENVVGLLNDKNKPYFNGMVNLLKDEYKCSVEWNVYDSSDFGLCQSRKRLFLIASRRKKKNLLPIVPPELSRHKKFIDICDKDPERTKNAIWSMSTHPTARAKEMRQKGTIKYIVKDKDALKGWEDSALKQVDDVLPTVTCAWGGGATRKKVAILDDDIGGLGWVVGMRHPTILEGLRAQGCPDSWLPHYLELSESLAWTMIGNAVACPVAENIARHLQKSDSERKTCSVQSLTEGYGLKYVPKFIQKSLFEE